MFFQIKADFRYEGVGLAMDDFLDAVYEHLTSAIDCGPVSIVSDGNAEFTTLVTLDRDDDTLVEQALLQGMSTLRTAFHAVGAATPGWPTHAPCATKSEVVTLQPA